MLMILSRRLLSNLSFLQINDELANLAHSTGGRFHVFDGESCFGNKVPGGLHCHIMILEVGEIIYLWITPGRTGDDVELISDEVLRLRKCKLHCTCNLSMILFRHFNMRVTSALIR